MGIFWQALLNTLETVVAVLLVGLLAARSLKHNQGERTWLIARWIISAAVVFGITKIGPAILHDRDHAILGMTGIFLTSGILAVLWAPHLSAWLARPFSNLIDGGEQEVETSPHYSAAVARRQAGKFAEAIAEIEEQLARFPGEYTGLMLLASIQAENLNDLSAAQATVELVAGDPKFTPYRRTAALNALADWHVQVAGDGDAARLCFERIIELFPDGELAQGARQRLAHLRTSSEIAQSRERVPIVIKPREKDLGLRGLSLADAQAPEPDPAELVNQLLEQLQLHPHDWDARERLAMIYADHYQRLDLASAELEQLISTPRQPPKRVAQWLNLLAELHLKLAHDEAAARSTLQRIVDLYPNTADATKAARAINYVSLGRRQEPEQAAAPEAFGKFMRSRDKKEVPDVSKEKSKPRESR